MSLEEVAFLFTVPNQKDAGQLRDLSILVLLYESGARIQELLDLCPRHMRFGSTTTVELHGKGNKTRLVPVNADAASIVKNYIRHCKREGEAEPLFINRRGEKLTRVGIQYIIDKYVSIAREDRPDLFRNRITNHSFRHSKAMHLLEAGVNLIYIRDFLGHSSVVTTEIYARTNPKIKEEQLKKHSSSIENVERYDKQQKEDLIAWLKNNL
jgi:site-specific recombinase XerD